jgi:branched-chain amino acid transport system ATP-binding protein
MKEPIFSVERLGKYFGGVVAIADLSFEVQAGEALGFMGPNGAGKTTLINVISGEFKPDTGTVRFKGKNIAGLPPHEICSLGIGRTYQIPLPFAKLTTLQNIAVAAMYGGRLSKSEAEQEAVRIIGLVGLEDKKEKRAGDLEEISLKRLELARVLATKPTLLLIDELAAGLTEREIPALLDLLKEIRGMGTTMILIEHVMKVMMNAVDRIIVMDGGMKIAEGKPEEVIEDRKVIEAYFGSDENEEAEE